MLGLVHDPRRQLDVAGVRDREIAAWFASLLIFARESDHAALRRTMTAAMRAPAFEDDEIRAVARRVVGRLPEAPSDAMRDLADPIVDGLGASLCRVDAATYAPVAGAVRDLALIHRLDPAPVTAAARTAVDTVDAFLRRTVLVGLPGGPTPAPELVRSSMSFLIGLTPLRLSIGTAIHLLAATPRAWDALGEDPDLAQAAADEVLRFLPSAPVQVRFATAEVALRHHVVAPGRPVLVCVTQANRDLGDDGDRFDPTRRPERPHLSFGGGRHYCIAARPARHQLAAVLHELAAALEPPVPAGATTWEPPSGVHGPVRQPVVLARRHRRRG